jgi:hypothetical protein
MYQDMLPVFAMTGKFWNSYTWLTAPKIGIALCEVRPQVDTGKEDLDIERSPVFWNFHKTAEL